MGKGVAWAWALTSVKVCIYGRVNFGALFVAFFFGVARDTQSRFQQLRTSLAMYKRVCALFRCL
eukprot:5324638-Pleurochrysis_carterae.AAC.1